MDVLSHRQFQLKCRLVEFNDQTLSDMNISNFWAWACHGVNFVCSTAGLPRVGTSPLSPGPGKVRGAALHHRLISSALTHS